MSSTLKGIKITTKHITPLNNPTLPEAIEMTMNCLGLLTDQWIKQAESAPDEQTKQALIDELYNQINVRCSTLIYALYKKSSAYDPTEDDQDQQE